MSFIFGGNTGRTYEDIQRLRKQAQELTPTGNVRGGIAGFGEGLSALGRGLLARQLNKKADKYDTQNRDQFQQGFNDWASQADTGGIDPRLAQLSGSSYATPGQQALMELILKKQMPQERKIMKDAMGRQRYQDDGSFVFSDMQDYDKNLLSDAAAAQKRTIAESGRNNINVNNNQAPVVPEYSTLDKGFVYKRRPDGQIEINDQGVPVVVPISGSQAERDREKEVKAAEAKNNMKQKYGSVVAEDIDRAVKLINQEGFRLPVTGFGSTLASSVAGTDSHQLSKYIDTVKANSGFDKLQELRDSSPTGGALGQVSNMEIQFLQAAIGNLEQSQNKEELLYNLERVKKIYNEIAHGPQGGANDPLGLFQ